MLPPPSVPEKDEHKIKTAFTRCRHILRTMKKGLVAKFELELTRCRNNLKTVGNMTVKTLCKTLMPRKCIYILRIDHSLPKAQKNVLFTPFSSIHTMPFPKCAGESSVFKIYRFQNLPAKNVPFSREREAYPSHFSPFQNLPASV